MSGLDSLQARAALHRTVHLIVDMVNPLQFPGAERLAPQALRAAERIAQLKRRLRGAGIPTVYVNDNFGQWRLSFVELVEECRHLDVPKRIVELVGPDGGDDHYILKPKHSAFYATSLDVLLHCWKTERLVLTGIAGNICVLFTANDAHMREYALVVPGDCVASELELDNRWALDQMGRVLSADIRPSSAFAL